MVNSNMFFPRGPGPLVSIILPTRGRHVDFCASLDSLYSLAKDKSCLEFIVKVDDDDKETIATCEKLKGLLDYKLIISPRGNGYADMHHWVNDMALNYATGDWCMIWNDDAILANGTEGPGIPNSQNWDERVLHASFLSEATWHACPDVCSLITPTVGRPDASEFFFLRRKVVQILGHWALNAHTDNYLQSVLCAISSSFRFPIYVAHKSDGVKDNVRKEVLEAYKTAGRELNTLECRRSQITDVNKLIDYIENWRRERCGSCRGSLIDLEYKDMDSGCKHGIFRVCNKCVADNKLGKCPVCDQEPKPVLSKEFVVSF